MSMDGQSTGAGARWLTRVSNYPLPPSRYLRWLLVFILGVGLTVLAMQWFWHSGRLKDQQARRVSLNGLLAERLAAQPSKGKAPATVDPSPLTGQAPREWPVLDAAVDGWLKQAIESAAKNNGVQLNQLTITRPELDRGAERNTAPLATLKTSGRGTYAALKSWQAELQGTVPSLALESVRLQAPPNDGTGQLLGEWVWRLWVQPAGWMPEQLADLQMSTPRRPTLLPAQRDPFGLPPPPAPPPVTKPVARAVEPPPLAAPVIQLAPPPQWTTIGRLRGPDGKHRVTGHWGSENDTLTLAEGDAAPSGYKVQRITNTEMELLNPETKDRMSVRLPPPPRFETR